MGRKPVYATNAERQAAYRARKKNGSKSATPSLITAVAIQQCFEKAMALEPRRAALEMPAALWCELIAGVIFQYSPKLANAQSGNSDRTAKLSRTASKRRGITKSCTPMPGRVLMLLPMPDLSGAFLLWSDDAVALVRPADASGTFTVDSNAAMKAMLQDDIGARFLLRALHAYVHDAPHPALRDAARHWTELAHVITGLARSAWGLRLGKPRDDAAICKFVSEVLNLIGIQRKPSTISAALRRKHSLSKKSVADLQRQRDLPSGVAPD